MFCRSSRAEHRCDPLDSTVSRIGQLLGDAHVSTTDQQPQMTADFRSGASVSTMKVAVVPSRRSAGGMAPGHSGPVAAAGGQGPYR
jgi:hypothetical protein